MSYRKGDQVVVAVHGAGVTSCCDSGIVVQSCIGTYPSAYRGSIWLMPNHVCPQCHQGFYHRKSARQFCSRACYTAYQRANPNSGTFPQGDRPHNVEPVGTMRIRTRHKRGGVQRAFVKVAEPNVWRLRAVVVYEATNGRVPNGHVVHHKNGNKLDDRPENLVALSRAEHLIEHRPEFEGKRRARIAEGGWGKSARQT